ncbi:Yli [Neorhizobium galegae bv. orientalis]|nr:Yli [Neorhizobium galegae bv. orientalis]
MKYGAVTFDTQTIDSNRFDFDSGALQQLKSLRDSSVQVVLSEIVRSEIQKHVIDHVQKTLNTLDAAIKKARSYRLTDIEQPVRGQTEAQETALTRVNEFFSELGVEMISPEQVPVSELMKRYSDIAPPFSPAKRKEFPDAITLMSLEIWARDNNTHMLAISGDGDWQAFGNQSDWIDVVADIPAAMDLLNEGFERQREIVTGFISLIEQEPAGAIASDLRDAIERALDRLNITGEASSSYHVEGDQVQLQLQGYRLLRARDFELIGFDDKLELFVVAVDAQLKVKASTHFYLSAYDSVDRDYIGLGSTYASMISDLEVKLIVMIFREEGSFNVHEVTITDAPSVLEFHEVEPDFGNYYDEDRDPGRDD